MSETGKECRKCGIFKPLSGFRKRAQGKLGRQSHCKECGNAYMRKYRARTTEQRLAYNREYYASERGKSVIANYTRKNWPKKSASLAVTRALQKGKITKPETCEECGADRALDAHHDDYRFQLDVRWLCRPCHKKWHRINGEGKNADLLPVYLPGTDLLIGYDRWEPA